MQFGKKRYLLQLVWYGEEALLLLAGVGLGRGATFCSWYDLVRKGCVLQLVWFGGGVLSLVADVARERSAALCRWWGLRKNHCLYKLVELGRRALPLGAVERKRCPCGWDSLGMVLPNFQPGAVT